jgi:hypothetical protein
MQVVVYFNKRGVEVFDRVGRTTEVHVMWHPRQRQVWAIETPITPVMRHAMYRMYDILTA